MVAKMIEYASEPQLGVSTGHVKEFTLNKQYITSGTIPIKVDHDVTLIAEYFVIRGCANIDTIPTQLLRLIQLYSRATHIHK